MLQARSRFSSWETILSRCLYRAGTALQMAWSCSAGVRPLLLSTWCSLDRAISEMEPTRIMKNSSRLLVKMEANFSRSNRGTLSSLASASTRSSKRSQDSSRSWV